MSSVLARPGPFERETMAGADKALEFLQAKNVEALRARTHSRSFAQQQMQHYLDRLSIDLTPLNVVHVAGSKGKGSTCAFTEAILAAHGLRTALYSSPHLVSLTERYRVDGAQVPDAVFLKHFWRVWDGLWDTMPEGAGAGASAGGDASVAVPIPPLPAYFAFLTLVGFDIFLASGVDVVLLEVGLGGKLDATNAVPTPLVTAITPLALEHTEILGTTLAAIAGEKAGIAKQGVPIFSAPQDPEALGVLLDAAAAVGVPLQVVLPLGEGTGSSAAAAAGVPLGLQGNHQRQNASMAVALAQAALLQLDDRAKAGKWRALPPAAAEAVAIARGLPVAVTGALPAPEGVTVVTLAPPSAVTDASATKGDEAATAAAAAAAATPVAGSSGSERLFPASGALAALTAHSVVPVVTAPSTGGGSARGGSGLRPLVAAGLSTAHWAGRCQTVPIPGCSNATVLLDGAHTVESIRLCLAWFADVLAKARAEAEAEGEGAEVEAMLLFNCGHVRNPFNLLDAFAGGSETAKPESKPSAGAGACTVAGADAATTAAALAVTAPALPPPPSVSFTEVLFCPFDHDRLHILGPQSLDSLAASCGRELPASTRAGLAAAGRVPGRAAGLGWQRTLLGVWYTLAGERAAREGTTWEGEVTVVPLGENGEEVGEGVVATAAEFAEKAEEGKTTASTSPDAFPDGAGAGGLSWSRPASPSSPEGLKARCVPSVAAALARARARAEANPKRKVLVLVTGSLYLVGNTLGALQVKV